MELTSGRHKILLHLESLKNPGRGFVERKKAPHGLCQKGISEAINLSQGRTSHLLKDLIKDGIVKEDVKRVVGYKRRRKVYSLTPKGLEKAIEIRKKLEKEKVILKKGSSDYEVRLENIDSYVDSQNALMLALNNINDEGVIDLTQEQQDKDIFVGRDDEINFLLEKLNQVKNNTSSTILIKGKAGIGKTKLVNEFKNRAVSEGFEFLSGKGHYNSSEPYLPFREAFETIEEEYLNLLKFSKEGNEEAEKSYKNIEEIESKRDLTFSETTKNLRKLSQSKAMVIFIDDLQWADKATLMLFHYLSDRLGDVPVLLIGATRPQSNSDDDFFEGVLERMSKEDLYDKLELGPLEWEDTKEISKGVIGNVDMPDRFVQLIHEISEGNPLFLKEILREMLEDEIVDPRNNRFPTEKKDVDFPKVVGDIIERRIRKLNQDTLRVLQTGSIIGEEIPFSLLLSVIDMKAFDLLESIDILIGNGLWEGKPSEDMFYFSHGLIHKFVYEDIPDSLRKYLHSQIAKTMEEKFEDSLEHHFSDIGFHYKQAEDFSRGFEFYKKAGEKAQEIYAHQDAIDMYEMAQKLLQKAPQVEEQKRWELLENLGDLYKIQGKYDKSIENYKKIPMKKKNVINQQKILRKIADIHERRGKFEKSLETISKGLEKKYDEKNIETCRLLLEKGRVKIRQGEYPSAKEEFLNALEICEELGKNEEYARVYEGLGLIYLYTGEFTEAIEYFKDAKNRWEKSSNLNGEAYSLNCLGSTYLAKGNYTKALNYYKKSLDKRKKIGDERGVSSCFSNIGAAYLKKGDLEKSIGYFQKGYDKWKKQDDQRGISTFLINIGEYYYQKGQLDIAREKLEKSLKICEKISFKRGLTACVFNIGKIHLYKNEIEDAKENYQRGLKLSKEIGYENVKPHILEGLIKINVEEGRLKEALEKGKEALKISRNLHAKELEAISYRTLGIVYREKEELDKAEEKFKNGIKIIKDMEKNIELPKFFYQYALLWKEKGKKRKSRKYLKKSHAMFEEMGMKLWIEKCEEELS